MLLIYVKKRLNGQLTVKRIDILKRMYSNIREDIKMLEVEREQPRANKSAIDHAIGYSLQQLAGIKTLILKEG